MVKNSLLVFTLSLSIIGGATAAAYASQSTVDSTKNKVVTVASKSEVSGLNQSQEGNPGDQIKITKGKISDEEAVNIAAKAMKDYMGLDANSFGEAHITRTNQKADMEFFKNIYPKEDAQIITENEKKPTANVINVQFIPADNLKQPMPARDLVIIDEKTGEVVSITAIANIDASFKATIDDSKVKEAISSFLNKMGKNIQDTLKVSKDINSGTITVIGNLEDGRDVTMMVNLPDYSVISYQLNYDNLVTLPSVVKDHQENFREIQVR